MKKKILFSFILLLSVALITACRKKPDDVVQGKPCDHLDTEWITVFDSTCHTLGQKEQVCQKCNKVITTAIINMKNHTEVVVPAKDATCTEEGLTSYKKCSVCNQTLVEPEVIPALNHNYKLDVESLTDTLAKYECTNCNESYFVEITNGYVCEGEHTEGEFTLVEESTCSKNGKEHKTCLVCGIELEVNYLPLASHEEEVIKGYEPSCGVDGLTDGLKCSSCGKMLTEQKTIEKLEHEYVITNTVFPTEDKDGYNEYTCSNCQDTYQDTLPATGYYDETKPVSIYLSDNKIINNNSGVTFNNNIIMITLGGEYDLYGELNDGSIIVNVDEESNVILNLRGIKITSSSTNPIEIQSGNKIEISAKSETTNYITDKRSAIATDMVGGAIYSLVDLELKGKGELIVNSTYNNGIASTKDLKIKNLTLEVNAPNNALKGNDSITIESGNIKAISSSGDALKTENSDISSKGNQRGNITILDGNINLYSACDGIDASYDVIIEGGTINIYTEKYSSYSGEVTTPVSSKMYLRISSRASSLNSISKYSAMFITEDGDITWCDGTYQLVNNRKYYQFDVPSNAKYVKFFAYASSMSSSQSTSYSFVSDQQTLSTSYDTYYVSSASSTRISGSWENFNSPSGGGMGGRPGGGMGGPMEGNPNASEYSCKGIKADNSITIINGIINIKSRDDAIHTNSDVLLDTGKYGLATLTINGGNISVYSDDDGIHADGELIVNGGNIVVTNAYEGLEGNIINFIGGTIQIRSLDDAINAKSTLYFKGSTVYLDAGGDGIDSNGNVYMSAGIVLALGPTNGGNGVIDFGDRNCTFSFTGGLLLAMGCSGMNAKPTASSGNTVSATTVTSPSINSYVTITSNSEVIAVVKVTKTNQNYRVLAYNNADYPSTSVSVSTSTSYELTNGLYYINK